MYKSAKHYAKKPSHETIFTALPQVPLLSQRQPQFHQPAVTERQQEVSPVMVRNGVLHPPRNVRKKGIKTVMDLTMWGPWAQDFVGALFSVKVKKTSWV